MEREVYMKTLQEVKELLKDNPKFEVPGQFCELIDLDKDEGDDMCRKAGTYSGEQLELFQLIKKTIRTICYGIEYRIANSKAYEVKGLMGILQQGNREGYGNEENRIEIQDAKERGKKQSGGTNRSGVKF